MRTLVNVLLAIVELVVLFFAMVVFLALNDADGVIVPLLMFGVPIVVTTLTMTARIKKQQSAGEETVEPYTAASEQPAPEVSVSSAQPAAQAPVQRPVNPDQEVVLAELKPSSGLFLSSLVVSILLVVCAAMVAGELAVLCACVIFAWPIYELVRLSYNRITLTNKKISAKIIGRSAVTSDIPLQKINGVEVIGNSKYPQVGNLQLNTSSGNYLFPFAIRPGEFRDKAVQAIEDKENERIRRQAEEIARAMKA